MRAMHGHHFERSAEQRAESGANVHALLLTRIF